MWSFLFGGTCCEASRSESAAVVQILEVMEDVGEKAEKPLRLDDCTDFEYSPCQTEAPSLDCSMDSEGLLFESVSVIGDLVQFSIPGLSDPYPLQPPASVNMSLASGNGTRSLAGVQRDSYGDLGLPKALTLRYTQNV
ncbi:unnamed protein product [Polarella glacialis]|uniref:Uncharacterized protein n=2 Tax=Polarella glacialis TaxID=89957 RepID=A0A813FU60_POLGL|nr:unnamed protein product [Polarella glacialis]